MLVKGIEFAQKGKVNDRINELRLNAFRTNLPEDREALMMFMLQSWSNGDLLDREVTIKYKEYIK